jgi:hypothetical protein
MSVTTRHKKQKSQADRSHLPQSRKTAFLWVSKYMRIVVRGRRQQSILKRTKAIALQAPKQTVLN